MTTDHRKEKITCECGATFTRHHKWWHEKNSKEHHEYILKQEQMPVISHPEDGHPVLANPDPTHFRYSTKVNQEVKDMLKRQRELRKARKGN